MLALLFFFLAFLEKSARSHCGDCINYHVFTEKVLGTYFKMTGSGLSRNLH